MTNNHSIQGGVTIGQKGNTLLTDEDKDIDFVQLVSRNL